MLQIPFDKKSCTTCFHLFEVLSQFSYSETCACNLGSGVSYHIIISTINIMYIMQNIYLHEQHVHDMIISSNI